MPCASSMTSTGGISAASLRAVSSCRLTSLVSVMALLSLLDRDAARLGRLVPRYADVQHAVAVRRGHGIGVDVVGQRDHAAEATGKALADVDGRLLVLRRLHGLALA